jgi:methionyl-tRNA formyltransferase
MGADEAVLVFMGTPDFAVPSLEALCRAGLAPRLVYTQPPRPKGRGRRVQPSPVAVAAGALGLEVRAPEILQRRTEREFLKGLRPDLIVTVAYGKILRRRWLELPRLGCLNLHPSLLPRYRGPNPIGRALLRGERWTGVTTFLMEEGTDTGPILRQQTVAVDPLETFGELEERLARIGAELLVESVRALLGGTVRVWPQREELATYAPVFGPEETWVCWRRPAPQVHDQIRALSPDPGARVRLGGRLVKIHRSRPQHLLEAAAAAGTVVGTTPEGNPLVACQPGLLEILEVQPEGRRRMPAAAWIRGLRCEVVGESFQGAG